MPPDPSRRASALSRTTLVISVVAGLLALCWVVAAVAMAGRGLAISDESFYLLSYRWWNVDLRTYTGAQYLYGPVFQLLDFSVQGLRVFRVATVVVAHGVFGWSFMTWLRLYRPGAVRSRAWVLAGVLVIVASGGIVYGWLPQSPGYNDVATLGSLLAAAVVLRILRRIQVDRVLPVLPALAVGPLVVGVSLAKWSSAVLTFGFLAVVLVLGARSVRARGWVRHLGLIVASTAASAVFFDVAIMPFRRSLPPMIEVNRLVAESSNSPTSLLRVYLVNGLAMVADAAVLLVIAVAVGAVGWLLANRGHRLVGGALAVAGPPAALIVRWPATLGVPGGGAQRLNEYPVALVALALAVAVASVADAILRRRGRRTDPARGDVAPAAPGTPAPDRRPTVPVLVVVMLLVLPLTGAMGTGNPLQYVAVNEFACWVAVLIMAVTALPAGGALALFAGTSTACAVLICSTTGANGVLVHPYRSSNFETSTTSIGGDGVVAPLLVSRAEAEFYRRLRAVLGTEVRPGRPMMSFAGGSGLILALGGRSVGEGWYPTRDWDRSAAGIRSACAHGNPWPRDLQPLIIYGRPDDRRDRAALGSCGLHFRTDYDLAGVVQGPNGPLELYVPDVHHRLPRR